MDEKVSKIRHNLNLLWQTRERVYDTSVLIQGEKNLTFAQKSISSFIASTLTNLAVTPLDVVKVRLQAQEKIHPTTTTTHTTTTSTTTTTNNNETNGELVKTKKNNRLPHDITTSNNRPRLTSAWNTFRTIIKTEGVASLWSGIWPTLLISIPVTILYFPLYDKVKYLLGYDEQDPSTSYIPPIAGMACRAVVVTIFNPIELYRTKLQSTPLTLLQLIHASKLSYHARGPSFLFFGTSAALLRDVPFSAIYWFLYERVKAGRLVEGGSSRTVDSLIAGAVAGTVAATVTAPFDVLKTHWQIELGSKHMTSSSSFAMMGKLWSQKGLRGLFAGIVPRLVRVTPSCAIMVSSYEGLKELFVKYNALLAEEGEGG